MLRRWHGHGGAFPPHTHLPIRSPLPLNHGLLNTKRPQSHLPPQPWLPAKGVEGLLPVPQAAQAPRLRRSWSQEKRGRCCWQDRGGEGAGPGEGPEPVCLNVQVAVTWHLLTPGLWTVNRSGHGVGRQAKRGGGWGRTVSVLSRERVSWLPPSPLQAGHLEPHGTVWKGGLARRVEVQFRVSPRPTPFHFLPLNFPELLVSPNTLTRIRGAGSLFLPNLASEPWPSFPGSAQAPPSWPWQHKPLSSPPASFSDNSHHTAPRGENYHKN